MERVSMVATYSEASAQPTHRAVMESAAVSRAALLVWGPIMDVPTLSWFDAGPTAVRELLSGVDPVETARLVPDENGTYAFVDRSEREFDGEVLTLIGDADVVFVPPLTFEDTGELRFEAVGERDRLAAFHEALSTLVDVRIERVTDFHRTGSTAALTERQRRALEAAHAVGYYEIPRSGGVDAVADRLECAPSTAGELLRKAERAVVTSFLSDGTDRR